MLHRSRPCRGLIFGRRLLRTSLWLALLLALPLEARAFCGFYVGKADASLYNNASQVALVRDGRRTVISMMNDYQGELKEFALVVPVPVVLEKGQIHVGDKSLFEHLDAYSAPRLVEYFDEDPCQAREMVGRMMALAPGAAAGAVADVARARSLGVTIEAQYTVSARQSDGLETWLAENGYRIPRGASRALQPYVRQGMKFFVARVNLEEQAKTGVSYLRPLQFAFESETFMLPIRLGMLNARGAQDLIVYVLTRTGRVETTNYRTVMLLTGMEIPEYVKDSFPAFYKAMFARQVERESGRAVFTEYLWNMGWCDPCSADPLSPRELRALGVFWLDEAGEGRGPVSGGIAPPFPRRIPAPPSGPAPVILTRLHVRYTADTFPEDLVFQETADRANFQGRYVLRHPWKGEAKCEAAERYRQSLRVRAEREASNLSSLTGWPIEDIRRKIGPVSDSDGKHLAEIIHVTSRRVFG